jgi:HlyD family secretion protein
MSVVEPEMEVDETSIPAVAVGQEALLRVDAYPNQTFDGVVTEVGSSPILGTGPGAEAIKFKVRIRIQNPPPGIKPGLSVQADILTGFRAKALTVPIQALVLREKERKPGEALKRGEPRDEEGVWVIDKDKVAFRPIQVGMLGELSVEVLGGLKGGEKIVTGPFRALRSVKEGDVVREEKPPPGENGTPAAKD